jgi:hypothetical protein
VNGRRFENRRSEPSRSAASLRNPTTRDYREQELSFEHNAGHVSRETFLSAPCVTTSGLEEGLLD